MEENIIVKRKNKETELVNVASSEFEDMVAQGIKMIWIGIALTTAGYIGRSILQAFLNEKIG
jgi:hypothetical protein